MNWFEKSPDIEHDSDHAYMHLWSWFPKGVLEKELAAGNIVTQRHPEFENILIYNYSRNATYSHYWPYVVRQLRGVAATEDGKVLSRPYPKFFNLEEAEANVPKGASYEIMEKEDGFLITAFVYRGELFVSSRGSFTSEYAYMARTLLMQANWGEIEEDETWIFELVGYERIVVKYDEPRLIMHGFRHSIAAPLANASDVQRRAEALGVECAERYPSDLPLGALPIRENAEGYVITFNDAKRTQLKVKFEWYKERHSLLQGLNSNKVWEAMRDGVYREFYKTVFEEARPWVDMVHKEIQDNALDLFYRTWEEVYTVWERANRLIRGVSVPRPPRTLNKDPRNPNSPQTTVEYHISPEVRKAVAIGKKNQYPDSINELWWGIIQDEPNGALFQAAVKHCKPDLDHPFKNKLEE